MTSDEGRPVEVRLVGLPLELYRRAREHLDAVVGEFQLVDGTRGDVPSRLLGLVAELRAAYAALARPADETRDAAIARGDQSVDLVYVAPRTGTTDALRMARLLDEADEFCRTTGRPALAMPEELVEFRRWFFGEFIRQLNDELPTPWPEFTKARPGDP